LVGSEAIPRFLKAGDFSIPLFSPFEPRARKNERDLTRNGLCQGEEKELIDDGLLESFDVITLIAEIEDQFGIEIPAEEIVPENFNSAEGIWNLCERIRGDE